MQSSTLGRGLTIGNFGSLNGIVAGQTVLGNITPSSLVEDMEKNSKEKLLAKVTCQTVIGKKYLAYELLNLVASS